MPRTSVEAPDVTDLGHGSLWGNPLAPELRVASPALYSDVLAVQGEQLEEVAHNRAAIQQAGEEIINGYEIRPSLFEDEARSLVFTAIANRWAAATHHPEAGQAEKTFLFSAVVLLAYDHSPILEAHRLEIDPTDSPEGKAHALAVYDKYTDQGMSWEFQDAIDNGLLDEVKGRLGVTPENEDPYEVRILSIDPFGFNSTGLKNKSDREGLTQRGYEMATELDLQRPPGNAWVARSLGDSKKRVMCLPLPLAQKLLHPELSSRHALNDLIAKKDQALVEHEFTHTQAGMHVDGQPYIGINLEELRAEEFSGNRRGYKDIKGFFMDVALVTGFDAKKVFTGKPKGGTAAEAYTAIAAQLGLDSMLEVLLACPKAYVGEDRPDFQRLAFDYIGGYDGVTERLISREMDRDKGETMHGRIAKVATAVEWGQDRFDDFGSRRLIGLTLVTDMIEEQQKAIRRAKRQSTRQ